MSQIQTFPDLVAVLGLSLRALAELSGVPAGTLSMISRGLTGSPHPRTLGRLHAAVAEVWAERWTTPPPSLAELRALISSTAAARAASAQPVATAPPVQP